MESSSKWLFMTQKLSLILILVATQWRVHIFSRWKQKTFLLIILKREEPSISNLHFSWKILNFSKIFSKASNNRTWVIPFTFWAFKLIPKALNWVFNNIRLSYFANNMKRSFPRCIFKRCCTVIRYFRIELLKRSGILILRLELQH